MEIKQILEIIQLIILAILGIYSLLLAVGVRLAPYSKRLGLLLLGFVVVLAIPLINKFLKKREEAAPEFTPKVKEIKSMK